VIVKKRRNSNKRVSFNYISLNGTFPVKNLQTYIILKRLRLVKNVNGPLIHTTDSRGLEEMKYDIITGPARHPGQTRNYQSHDFSMQTFQKTVLSTEKFAVNSLDKVTYSRSEPTIGSFVRVQIRPERGQCCFSRLISPKMVRQI
jgi:hypothetical protein